MALIALLSGKVLKISLSACLSVAFCLSLDLSPTFALITVLLAWDGNNFDAVRRGTGRLIAAFIGTVFALFLFYTLGAHPFVYSCIILLTFVLCRHFNIGSFTEIASITAIAIMPSMIGAPISDYIGRVMSTVVGIIISTTTHLAIALPNYTSYLLKTSAICWKEFSHIFSTILRDKRSTPLNHGGKDPWRLYDSLYMKLQKLERMSIKQRKQWEMMKASPLEARRLYTAQRRIQTMLRLLDQLYIFRNIKSQRRHQFPISLKYSRIGR